MLDPALTLDFRPSTRAPRRYVRYTREMVGLAVSLLISAAASFLSAGKLAAALLPAQHTLLWFMRCSLIEFQLIFTILFPVRRVPVCSSGLTHHEVFLLLMQCKACVCA